MVAHSCNPTLWDSFPSPLPFLPPLLLLFLFSEIRSPFGIIERVIFEPLPASTRREKYRGEALPQSVP